MNSTLWSDAPLDAGALPVSLSMGAAGALYASAMAFADAMSVSFSDPPSMPTISSGTAVSLATFARALLSASAASCSLAASSSSLILFLDFSSSAAFYLSAS